MDDLEVGQVLSFKIRFNKQGDVATENHPCLIIGMDNEMNTIEIAHMDKIRGKWYQAASKRNKVIFQDNPLETVIDEHSYMQMNNTIIIEYYPDIVKYRRQKEKLSPVKLADALQCYRDYHEKNEIDENRQVYITKEELERLNL